VDPMQQQQEQQPKLQQQQQQQGRSQHGGQQGGAGGGGGQVEDTEGRGDMMGGAEDEQGGQEQQDADGKEGGPEESQQQKDTDMQEFGQGAETNGPPASVDAVLAGEVLKDFIQPKATPEALLDWFTSRGVEEAVGEGPQGPVKVGVMQRRGGGFVVSESCMGLMLLWLLKCFVAQYL